VTLTARLAGSDDVNRIAEMNLQLIADEGSGNPMDVPALAARLRGWLAEGWEAVLFEQGGRVCGYAIYRLQRDEYDEAQTAAYLRQFFICRDRRREGIGRQALELLEERLLPPSSILELDVLEHNRSARAFWEATGFRSAYTRMRKRLPGGKK
jgi:GNAT superfamily N-acetyltransferase